MSRALAFILVCVVLPCGFAGESAREYFKFAKYSFDSQSYEKALSYVTEALKIDPFYINGYLLKADIDYRLGNYKHVVDDVTAAIELGEIANSTLADYLLLRGSAHLEEDDIETALSDISRSLRLNPNNHKAHFYKGIIKTKLSSTFEALECFNSAIEKSPTNAEYYFHRAELKKIHYKPIAGTSTYQNIMDDISVAIKLNPEDYRAYKLRCDMLKLDKTVDRAKIVVELNDLIEEFPNRPEFYTERGLISAMLNNYEGALSDFTVSIELDETNELVYRNRGLCYHNLNRYREAVLDYSNSIEILAGKIKTDKSKSTKKALAESFNMRGMALRLSGKSSQACEDFYNSAKLGSKSGLNNYKHNCNVYN